jgi:hypothetical protein
MATQGPACSQCGWSLGWDPAQSAWRCDRCHAVFPVGPPQLQPAPYVPQAQPAYAPQAQPAYAPQAQPAYAPQAQAPFVPSTPGYPPAQPLHGQPTTPPVSAKKSKAVLFAIVGALAIAGVIVLVVVLKGARGGLASRDELIQHTLAALNAGNAEALFKLGDSGTFENRVIDCDRDGGYDGTHEKPDPKHALGTYETAVFKAHDLKVELVGIDEKATTTHVDKQGSEADRGKGCRFTADYTVNDVALDLKITNKAGKSSKQKQSVTVGELGGRWYLLEAPYLKPVSADLTEMLAKLRGYKDRICACKDPACGEAAIAEEMTWMSATTKQLDPTLQPSSEDTRAAADLERQSGACVDKLDAAVAADKAAAAAAAAAAGTRPVVDVPPECTAALDTIAKYSDCKALPKATHDEVKQVEDALKLMIASGSTSLAAPCKQMTDMMVKEMGKLCP